MPLTAKIALVFDLGCAALLIVIIALQARKFYRSPHRDAVADASEGK